MSIFSYLADLLQFNSQTGEFDTTSSHIGADPLSINPDDFAINPANSLPMVGGSGGVDVAGNPYGSDFSNDYSSSFAFDDNCGSISGLSDW